MTQRPVPREARRRVVVVDDDPDARDILRKVLEAAGGYGVWEAAQAEAALGHLSAADLLVTDISMPGMGGLALIRRARREHPGLPILAMSGEPANRPEALAAGADAFLGKPCPIAAIQEAVSRLLAEPREPTEKRADGVTPSPPPLRGDPPRETTESEP